MIFFKFKNAIKYMSEIYCPLDEWKLMYVIMQANQMQDWFACSY